MPNKTSQGFTFFELLISLTLFSLLIALSGFALRAFFVKEELHHVEQNLQDLIEYARAQALVRAQAVDLCASEDGEHCQKLGAGQEWRGRLLVSSAGRVLQLKPALPDSVHLYWNSGFGVNNALSFDMNGASGVQQGSFILCPAAPYQYLAVALVVLSSGRLRLTNDYSKLAAQCLR